MFRVNIIPGLDEKSFIGIGMISGQGVDARPCITENFCISERRPQFDTIKSCKQLQHIALYLNSAQCSMEVLLTSHQ